ncbi:MAG: hypothetical protein ACE5NW_02175 [Acidiferrobacterales bacterium]
MKVHIQVNLLIAAVLFLLWALALFMGQNEVHPLLSTGPYDAVANSMLGASMLAFVVLFIIGVVNPIKELVYASVTAMAFLGLVAAYHMFLSDGMPQNPVTFFSLVITLSVAAILFFSMIQKPASSATGSSVRARRRPRPSRRPHTESSTKVVRRAPARKTGVKKRVRKKASLRRKR